VGLSGAECPGGTYGAGDVITRDPSGASPPRYATISQSAELLGVWCRGPLLCFASTGTGQLFVSTNPAGGADAWPVAYVDSAPSQYNPLIDVACPSQSLCVAIDAAGKVLIGSPPPTAAQIRALLVRQLAPVGKAARIEALLKQGGYSFTFKAPTAGRVVISWYGLTKGAHPASRKRGRTQIASGQASLTSAGARKITIKLTPNGTRLLKKTSHLSLTATGKFIPPGNPPITATRSFNLNP
jgi:hypothetical protein